MKKYEKLIESVEVSLWTLAIGTLMVLGSEWNYNYATNDRVSIREEEIIKTKPYSPLSYLEVVYENGVIKKVSQKSSLTNKEVLRFKLNNLGEIEEMVKDSSFIGKPNPIVYSPDKHKTMDWDDANKTAQEYILFFNDNKKNPYEKL